MLRMSGNGKPGKKNRVLQYFNSKLPIKLSSDANKGGLGMLILQLHRSTWKPVDYASRAMTSTENNYAQIEKDLFNIIFACKRFHQFIYWTPVKAETDHKPVVNIIKKPLNE